MNKISNEEIYKEVIVSMKLANNIKYIDKLIHAFGINEFKIREINEACLEKLKKGEISQRRKYFLNNYEVFQKLNKPVAYDEEKQKFIFNLCMNLILDEKYLEHNYYIDGTGNLFQKWLEELIYAYVSPNENIEIDWTNKIDSIETIIVGKKEVKNYKNINLTTEQKYIYETIKESKYFDEKYYLNNNKDVEESKINPCMHYAIQGYKEKRNPSILFDANKYRNENDDVLKADVNPLYHYLVAGEKENRKISDLGQVIKLQYSKLVKVTTPEIHDANLEEIEIKNSYEFIVLTHDNILKRSGGIQKVIRNEFKSVLNCLIIVPTSNIKKYIAIDFIEKKQYSISIESINKIKKVDTLVIHSLLNFDEIFLIGNKLFDITTNIKIWGHDYGLICPNFLLLRNNYEQCGAPLSDEIACEICVYNKKRKKFEKLREELFKNNMNKITFITPSEYSKAILVKGLQVESSKINVREHIKLILKDSQKKLNNKKIKIAYVGSDQAHKGFGIFFEIIKEDKNKEFYIFSEKNFFGSGVKFIPHSTNAAYDLDDLIKIHQIDIVVLPSLWEETFCLTAYESLAGGAKVFCFKNSGNLSEINNENLISYDNFEEMKNAIINYNSKNYTKSYYKIKNNMDLNYAKK